MVLLWNSDVEFHWLVFYCSCPPFYSLDWYLIEESKCESTSLLAATNDLTLRSYDRYVFDYCAH